ncbi:MAG TPA: hypothetical protein VM118_11685 [Acidobacteriota bacterium]|nr:hypothetical protein [Acidobacteriota bacterium]
MATLISTLVGSARTTLIESSASFWSDDELLRLASGGIRDLWKKVIDLNKDHFVTIYETNVAAAASTAALTGVPSDVFRVVALQPRTLGATSANRGLIFKPRELNHPDWVQSEASAAVTPSNRVVYYAIINAGAPVAAPEIHLSPQLASALDLTLKYIPTLGTLTLGSTNPIPGESDVAIKHYIIAFARAKEREDRAPDPEHLSIYATEARNLLTVLTPRSVQEPEFVVGMWEHDSAGSE